MPVGTIAVLFGKDFADRIWYPEYADPEVPPEGEGGSRFSPRRLRVRQPLRWALPTGIGVGVRVYVNGVAAPLFSVTPEQIYFLVPFETVGSTASVYVRRLRDDGTVSCLRAPGRESGSCFTGLVCV